MKLTQKGDSETRSEIEGSWARPGPLTLVTSLRANQSLAILYLTIGQPNLAWKILLFTGEGHQDQWVQASRRESRLPIV